MKKVYLAGSIFNNPDPSSWRQAAVKMLPEKWEAIDPCQFEKGDMSPQQLVELDYSFILRCQALIARVTRPTWGTAMELAFAKRHFIPVFAWSNNIYAEQSPWLLAHVTTLSSSLEEVIKELSNV